MSQSSQSTQPVNFYFGEKAQSISDEIGKYDPKGQYIISQNDFYVKEVKKLEKKIVQLETQLKEIEDDNEHMEVSKTNLKGYVSNMNVLNRNYKKLIENYNSHISKIRKNLTDKHKIDISKISKICDDVQKILMYHLFIFISINFLLFFICFYKGVNFIFVTTCVLVFTTMWTHLYLCIAPFYGELMKFKNIESFPGTEIFPDIQNFPDIVKIKEELKELYRGNDLLDQLIDLS